MMRWAVPLMALLAAAAPAAPQRAPEVLVVYSRKTPRFRPECPPGVCAALAIEDEPAEPGRPDPMAHIPTVILSGHGEVARYLGVSPERAAAAVARHTPELVVLDTCYGASGALLEALGRAGVTALIVGPNHRIKGNSLRYGPTFFSAAPVEARAAAVEGVYGRPLTRGSLQLASLEEAHARVDAMSAQELKGRLVHVQPNWVGVPVDGLREAVLFEVAPERFR